MKRTVTLEDVTLEMKRMKEILPYISIVGIGADRPGALHFKRNLSTLEKGRKATP